METEKNNETGYLYMTPDGFITACSQAMTEWFQSPYDQIVGSHVKEHIHSDAYFIFQNYRKHINRSLPDTNAPSVFQMDEMQVTFVILKQNDHTEQLMGIFEPIPDPPAVELVDLLPNNLHKMPFSNKSMEHALRQALLRNEFIIHYQPQVDVATGLIVGMEALLRWNHPDLGEISPSTFIPLAEETGLIIPLSTWVLEQACIQNKIFQSLGYPPIRVAVNTSIIFFQIPDFIHTIKEILRKTGLEPNYLELELTESNLIKNVHEAMTKLGALKKMGVRIAIDDFGTGYSSLSYLKHFWVDTIKMDQTFVKDVSQNQHDRYISTAIINLAHHLNMTVVAEGVETQEQVEFLKLQSCNRMQGYHFSRPLQADDFIHLLA